MCIANQIQLEPEWVPREENVVADTISRIVDYDDWHLDPLIFNWLDHAWGPHDVDRFADNYNTQLKLFNSRYACPNSEAIDAFTVNWCCENNWLCPSPGIVARVLRHAELCRAKGTLVIPWWPSAPFWPLLYTGCSFAPFVKGSYMVGDVLVQGRSGACLPSNTQVLALRICF